MIAIVTQIQKDASAVPTRGTPFRNVQSGKLQQERLPTLESHIHPLVQSLR